MERDDEVKGKGNSYDFGARMFDTRLGRWLSVDPHSFNYPGHSPYNFVNNTPLSAIDSDGKDVIILIWYPEGSHLGHTAIAVENYRQKSDEYGNLMFEEVMGVDNVMVKTPIMEKDGTYTYYDFWPENVVKPKDYLTDVSSDPKSKDIASLDVLLNTDQSASGMPGKPSYAGEGRAPDMAYRISTTMEEDVQIEKRLEYISKTRKYNAKDLNCTTFVIEGLRGGKGDNITDKLVNDLGTENVKSGTLGAVYGYGEYERTKTPTALSRSLETLSKKTEAGKLKNEPSVTVEKQTKEVSRSSYVDMLNLTK